MTPPALSRNDEDRMRKIQFQIRSKPLEVGLWIILRPLLIALTPTARPRDRTPVMEATSISNLFFVSALGPRSAEIEYKEYRA